MHADKVKAGPFVSCACSPRAPHAHARAVLHAHRRWTAAACVAHVSCRFPLFNAGYEGLQCDHVAPNAICQSSGRWASKERTRGECSSALHHHHQPLFISARVFGVTHTPVLATGALLLGRTEEPSSYSYSAASLPYVLHARRRTLTCGWRWSCRGAEGESPSPPRGPGTGTVGPKHPNTARTAAGCDGARAWFWLRQGLAWGMRAPPLSLRPQNGCAPPPVRGANLPRLASSRPLGDPQRELHLSSHTRWQG